MPVIVGIVVAVFCSVSAEEDLFADAGQSMSRSRWISIRTFPSIEIALGSDDTVLVESVNHMPKAVALKIDGESVAADCELTEREDLRTAYSVGQEKKKSDKKKVTTSTTSTVTTTTYHAACRFEEGTTQRAVEAEQIVVQLAMNEKTTKAHELSPKALGKFQRLDK